MESDIQILELEPEFTTNKFRTPLKFGGVVVPESTALTVKATVKNRRGEVGEGQGSMLLMDEWAFPEPSMPHEIKFQAMALIGERFCRKLQEDKKFGHPIDIFLNSKSMLLEITRQVDKELSLKVPMPVLGALVAASPTDAAIHDSFGRVNGICSYDGYGPKFMEHDLSFYLGDGFRGKYISDYLRPSYEKELPVFHLVGGLDKLTRDEVDNSDPKDGLPVSLEEWIERDGIFCLKVKLRGNDIDWDVERTKRVAEIASETLKRKGIDRFYLSADSNEMSAGPGDIIEYLRKLKRVSPLAFNSLLYIEQPTEREIGRHRFDMHEVAKAKPVLADEGVTDLESFNLALELGWSGVALKACKCHSAAMLYVVKAEELGIPYSVQDLTCPGLALVHSASLAARTKPIKGFEYNSRQYLPYAYEEIRRRHKGLFTVRDGKVCTSSLSPLGIGF